MALDEDAMAEVLANTSLENVPAQLPGAGLSGTRDIVSTSEQRERREVLSTLLSAGVSRDKLMETMMAAQKPDGSPGFSMTERTVTLLIAEVYQTWRDEDADGRPHKKAAAVRRIKRMITRAGAKGAFTAVAQLERTLMMIEGTAEPVKVEVTGVENVSAALIQVLNVQTPAQLEQLIGEEKLILKDHGAATLLPSGTEVIDATGE